MAFVLASALAAALLFASANDPVRTLPDAYKLQFENAWVKIVRVLYAPHVKLPSHDHPQMATAYVYLSDAGPVIFRHGGRGGAVTRPATKAGGFRLFRGVPNEVHEVENTADTASEFLRVELKTEPRNARTLRGRFPRDVVESGENLERIEFENEQVRITRLICAPGRTLRVATDGDPTLLVALSPARLDVTRGSGAPITVTLSNGQERWIDADQTEVLANRGGQSAEMLRFDFKTRPID